LPPSQHPARRCIAAIAICALGYGLEWQLAARTGRRALPKY
jgi:hypothetical protein